MSKVKFFTFVSAQVIGSIVFSVTDSPLIDSFLVSFSSNFEQITGSCPLHLK